MGARERCEHRWQPYTEVAWVGGIAPREMEYCPRCKEHREAR